ncbi:hypothetical protein QR680_015414 [Steinernema hermaphroditum]|uniref:Thioredoxin domain-containing protein n=1 Tax=Steinernema hermaphroditum TaxID=289476 RepID=A0AA39H7K7_9BILA|nr:hypothetical protein QR680_015414 [Steinernema hermaphroditum]
MRLVAFLLVSLLSVAFGSECPAFSPLDIFIKQFVNRQCIAVSNEVSRALVRVPFDVRSYRIVECAAAAESQETTPLRVVRNVSQIQEALAKRDPFGRPFCHVVVFYGEGCPFSVKMAEVVNALPRVYPRLNVMAIDASLTTKFNSRYGVAGTPMVVLYQDTHVRARLAAGYSSLENVVKAITDFTDLRPSTKNLTLLQEDKDGPLVVNPETYIRDMYFAVSLVAMLTIAIYSVSYTTIGTAIVARVLECFDRRRDAA